ncbi:ABC transporter permease [Natronogracilivirga saccharolytica]|uniref:Proline/glycine betaine ABC transporter permease n=1 Tax=Natronogracilivirga saccharolytica TaxID=2812953 RepID=A0A8J7RHS3_9BACT|nr:proline/glycine betaine ABC transporter permease [Natronogracilivirga saccharolytica]MBP3191437.1 proline/glycine betaine ABC transporter permease [Natronogracilivirga saccharolytica]
MLPFRVPLRDWVSDAVDYLVREYAIIFDSFSAFVFFIVNNLKDGLMAVHPAVLIVAIAALTWYMAGWRVSLFAALGLLLSENIGLWRAFIETLSLVITAELLVMAVGLPLGVLAARKDKFDYFIRPVLDFMQTMPAFVYLIPAVMFFGLGLVPGVVATFVFALPPLIRLTNLGIRQVPKELTEAADAFGATGWQKLFKVQIPVATPTIMAGVNQSIMLGLSMVVIAAMIGAGGLGADVLRGIQRLQVGQGFEAGLVVVILAIILDRITAGFGQKNK